MSPQTDLEEQLRSHVVGILREKMQKKGISSGEINDDFMFIGSGAIDSLDFLELLASVEKHFEVEADFSEKDPSEFLSLGGFVKSIMSLEGGSDQTIH